MKLINYTSERIFHAGTMVKIFLLFTLHQPTCGQLIAHWRFNGNGNDDNATYNATASNTSMFITSSPKEGTHALSFDNSSWYVNCGSIPFGTQFTITGWFKTWNQSSTDRPLMANSTYTTPNGFAVLINESSKAIRFVTGNGSSSSEANTTTGLWTAGDWVHFAIAVNKTTNTCQIYVNGILCTNSSAVYAGFNTTSNLLLGRDSNGVTAWCYMDDMHLYNCLLSVSDISSIISTYNSITCGSNVAVTGVVVSPTSASIGVGTTQQLTRTISPANATNTNVTWSSSNGAVVSVSTSGLVTGLAAGSATITVTTTDGAKTATSAITVTSSNIAVTGVTVTPTSASISTGSTQQLTRTIAPSNATNINVTWTTSTASVATVSTSGLITAIATGTATITVTTADGAKTASCAITVTNSSGDWVIGSSKIYFNSGNVGIGTANPTQKLTVNGKILSTEVEVVSSIASDYVFEPEYKLMPLTDLENYLQQHKHLPDFPSAAEFSEKGQNLGKTDDLLLRKIEELTLYVIQQDKEIKVLQKEMEKLHRRKRFYR